MLLKSFLSKKEFENRHRKARELMRKQRLDALFLTSDENFQYYSGGGGIAHMRSNARPNIVVLPADGDPIVVTHVGFTAICREAGAIKDIRGYESVFGVPNDMLVKAVKDAGLKNKRIGAELGQEQRLNMPVNDFLRLQKSLRGVRWVDASPIIWKQRMVKSKEEASLMRKAAEITGRARQKTFDELHAGMTERDVNRIFRRNMHDRGADRVSFVHVVCGKPANHTYVYFERELKNGDTLYLDGGAYCWTYTIDYPRLATVGKASADQVKAHAIIREASRKMAEALRPGRTCEEIFKIGSKALKDAGATTTLKEKAGRMGHGQGLLLTEPPSITIGDKTVLEPGLLTSVEPGYEVPFGEFTWEDTYWITEDGAEQLTMESPELREITP